MAEAAEEHGVQPAEGPECSSAAGGSREASPDVQAELELVAAGKPLPLKLMHAAPPSSSSPGSSPGIQAVHATPRSGHSSPSALPAPAAAEGEESCSPSPEHRREALSVEPASLPSSPFASHTVQAQPLRHTSSAGGEVPACGGRRSSSDGPSVPQHSLVMPAMGAPQPPVRQQQQQPPPQLEQQQQRQPAGQQVQPQQSSEDDEGEDVYARFGSYEEMVAHFRSLAANGQQPAEDEPEAEAEAQQASAAPLLGSTARCISLPRGLNEPELTVTAASSFSGRPGCLVGVMAGSGGRLACVALLRANCRKHPVPTPCKPCLKEQPWQSQGCC